MSQPTNLPSECKTAGHCFHDTNHKWAATKKGMHPISCYRCGAKKTIKPKGVR